MTTCLFLYYSIQELLILFSSLPTILPFVVGLLHFPRLSKEQKIMMWLALTTFIVGAWSAILWALRSSNLFIGHFYTIIQFVLIVRIYQLALRKFISTKWMTGLMILFSILSLLNTSYLQPLTKFNSYATTANSMIQVLISLLFFYHLITKPRTHRIEQIPMFWFSSGVLLYFFCNLFIFAISNSILPQEFRPLSIPTWILHNVFMWLFFILTSIAVWINPSQST